MVRKKSKLEFSSRSRKNNFYSSEGKHAPEGSVYICIIGKLWAVFLCSSLFFEENKSSILMVPHGSRILLKNLSLYFDIWVHLSFIWNFVVQELIKYSALQRF